MAGAAVAQPSSSSSSSSITALCTYGSSFAVSITKRYTSCRAGVPDVVVSTGYAPPSTALPNSTFPVSASKWKSASSFCTREEVSE